MFPYVCYVKMQIAQCRPPRYAAGTSLIYMRATLARFTTATGSSIPKLQQREGEKKKEKLFLLSFLLLKILFARQLINLILQSLRSLCSWSHTYIYIHRDRGDLFFERNTEEYELRISREGATWWIKSLDCLNNCLWWIESLN